MKFLGVNQEDLSFANHEAFACSSLELGRQKNLSSFNLLKFSYEQNIEYNI